MRAGRWLGSMPRGIRQKVRVSGAQRQAGSWAGWQPGGLPCLFPLYGELSLRPKEQGSKAASFMFSKLPAEVVKAGLRRPTGEPLLSSEEQGGLNQEGLRW